MKLPSLQQILSDAMDTLRRFPFVLAVAAAGTVSAIVLIEHHGSGEFPDGLRVLYAALLGIPFLTGLALLAEKRRWETVPRTVLQAVGVLLLALYAWTLPSNIEIAPEMHAIRLLMLAVGMHLFVAVAPWLRKGEVNGFWQYNKTLFLRMAIAALFSGVLFAGLAIALAAVENLFELAVPGERYGQLWTLLAGMFATWFFLAGVPKDLDGLDAIDDYPRGLKIFAQYVLLPLIAVYLVILVAYSGKIVIAWSWPNGWVSRLILGFSAAGMFALLLLHPIRDRMENGWMRSASRWFYAVLAPLLLMYFLAVMRRLSDYGITEGRYVAIMAGIWLAAMVLYFLLSRGKNIKAIPLTLCVLSFLIAVGPWSAFSVSERSQVNRLQELFEKNDMLDAGKVRPAKSPIPYADAKEISAVLTYLREIHGYEGIQPWFVKPLRENSPDRYSEWKSADSIAATLGIEYVAVQRLQSDGHLEFEAARKAALRVTGYDRVLPERYFNNRSDDRTVTVEDLVYELNATLDTLTFTSAGGEGDAHAPDAVPSGPKGIDVGAAAAVRVPLLSVVDTLLARYHGESAREIPPELMTVEARAHGTLLKIYLIRLSLERRDGGLQVDNLGLRILYGRGNENEQE